MQCILVPRIVYAQVNETLATQKKVYLKFDGRRYLGKLERECRPAKYSWGLKKATITLWKYQESVI